MQVKNILRIFAKINKGLVESIETFTARHWHAKNVIRIKSYQSKVAAANSQVFQTSSWRTQMLSNGGLGRRQLSLPPKLLQLQLARTLVPMALIKKCLGVMVDHLRAHKKLFLLFNSITPLRPWCNGQNVGLWFLISRVWFQQHLIGYSCLSGIRLFDRTR